MKAYMLRTIGVSEDFCDEPSALNGVCISICASFWKAFPVLAAGSRKVMPKARADQQNAAFVADNQESAGGRTV